MTVFVATIANLLLSGETGRRWVRAAYLFLKACEAALSIALIGLLVHLPGSPPCLLLAQCLDQILQKCQQICLFDHFHKAEKQLLAYVSSVICKSAWSHDVWLEVIGVYMFQFQA